MSVHTFSAREFTRDVSAAKRAAEKGPVFITDRGKPAYALLKIEDYYKVTATRAQSLLELMQSIPCEASVEFAPVRFEPEFKAAELA
jgi:PHD/YefM family antitoxin component YafN of YafNO toxin-antitoxin module